MRDIRYLLTAWANWAANVQLGLGYGSGWPVLRANSDLRPMLEDREAEVVNRAVVKLYRYDPLGYDIVVAHYRGKLSCRAIGEVMNPPRHHSFVSKVLERAEAYIAGRVDELLEVV